MNNDLISREALRKAFHERIYYFNKSSWDEANAIIDNAPTVVNEKWTTERPQGEWIEKRDNNGNVQIYCNVCGKKAQVGYIEFCGCCGADMRGKEE